MTSAVKTEKTIERVEGPIKRLGNTLDGPTTDSVSTPFPFLYYVTIYRDLESKK